MFDFLFLSNKYCSLCENKVADNHICKECMDRFHFIDGRRELDFGVCIYPLFYNNYVKELIKRFKYQNETHLVKAFTEILTEFIIKNEIAFDYISFVPMYYDDEFERGYNQSYLLAKEIGKKLDKKVVELSKKIKKTRHQNKLNPLERNKNLSECFGFSGKIKEYSRVLIVDDLVTTGSTFNNLSKVILENIQVELIFACIASSKIDD